MVASTCTFFVQTRGTQEHIVSIRAEEVCTHTDLTQGVRLWLAPDLVGRTRHETGKTEEQGERERERARKGEEEEAGCPRYCTRQLAANVALPALFGLSVYIQAQSRYTADTHTW
jgi:hypothetical protein